MEQEKNKNGGIIALLVVVIVILVVLCVLFATNTINFDSHQVDTSTIDNNYVPDVANDKSNTTDKQRYVGEYTGKDPWGDDLTVKINSISNDEINLIIETNLIRSNDSYKKEVTTELINDTAAFNIQGMCESKINFYNYGFYLTLIDDGIMIKYISGSMSTFGPNGQSASSRNASNEKLVLQKK